MLVKSGPGDGYGFEREFCGLACVDVNNRFRRHRVANLDEGIRRVRDYQFSLKWNPNKPKTPLAQCLFRQVASRLRRGAMDLRLFIAVGTRVDLMGIDCFFDYHKKIITIDLTTKSYKENPRAHFVITRDDFLENRHYQIGSEIAYSLK